MRVLARREPVDRRNARLVVSPIRAAPAPAGRDQGPRRARGRRRVGHHRGDPRGHRHRLHGPAPSQPRVAALSPVAERASARRAAKRRRNVLALVLLANAVVVGLAVAKVVAWPWVAAPVAVLVAWLVACRVSVRAERRQRALRSAIEIGVPPVVEEELDDIDLTGEITVTPPQPRAPTHRSPRPTRRGDLARGRRPGRGHRRGPGRRRLGPGAHHAADLRQQAAPPSGVRSPPSTSTPPASGRAATTTATPPSHARPSSPPRRRARPARPAAPAAPDPARPDARAIGWASNRSCILASRLRAHGAVAQLVARLVRNEKVRGSNPLSSTTTKTPQADRPAGSCMSTDMRFTRPGGGRMPLRGAA